MVRDGQSAVRRARYVKKGTNMKKLKKLARRIIGNPSSPRSAGPPIPNKSVNFEKRSIFIAVPKTGTTSVRAQLRPQGAPLIKNPHLNIMQVRDAIYVYLLKQTLGKNATFPSESIPTDADIRSQAREIFHTYFKFGAVRNPWARAVSLYSRREGIQTKDEISFEEFCATHVYASDTCHHPTLHKNQFDWFCDENGDCIVDYVYKLEEFDYAMKEIEERTSGRLKLSVRTENSNPNSFSRTYREFYTEKAKMMIARNFEKDIDYFKYVF